MDWVGYLVDRRSTLRYWKEIQSLEGARSNQCQIQGHDTCGLQATMIKVNAYRSESESSRSYEAFL